MLPSLTELALVLSLRIPAEQMFIDEAAATFGVNPLLLTAIIEHEAGETCSVNRNTDGSADLGRAQINTVHADELIRKFGLRLIDVACDDRINALVAAWHLRKKIDEAGGDEWAGAGRYHSKTAHHALNYVKAVQKRYVALLHRVTEQLSQEFEIKGQE